MASLKVLYRAIIMAGTLAVACLAYMAYGPELQQLQPVVNRLKEVAIDLLDESGQTAEASAEETLESPLYTGLQPLDAPAETPLLDPHVEPANLEIAERPVAAIIRRLEQLGVTEYSLTPWGSDGRYYRFACSAPWGVGGAFSRQFEAVTSDPETAARDVLQQVEKSKVQGRESRTRESATVSGF